MIEELAKKLKSGETTAEKLTIAYLEKIKSSSLNAFIAIEERAIAMARNADQLLKRGEGTVLTGIPMSLKDNLSAKGLKTTCASKMLANYTPIYDATVWEKLKNQGAVLLGKNNMDEFAMGSTSETSYFGAVKNPRDERRVAGGSSGGSASSVAGGLSVYALGTDTGGSVRQPASMCGCVGFKPTYGAISRYGLIAYASSLDTVGILTSSVTDAGIVYDAIRGRDEKDMTSVDTAYPYMERELKVGYLKEWLTDEVKSGLQILGGEAIECQLPYLKESLSAYYIIACAEASSNLGRYDGIRYGYRADGNSLDEMIVNSRSEGFGEEVKKRILLGTFALSKGYFDEYYQKACAIRSRLNVEFEKLFEKVDVLLLPTSAEAFLLGEKKGVDLYEQDQYTVPVNLAGLPAISVPSKKEGLPKGLQIVAGKFEEAKLLSIARRFERGQE